MQTPVYPLSLIIERELNYRDLLGVTAIGIDEIAAHNRHQYLTLIYQIDARYPRLL